MSRCPTCEVAYFGLLEKWWGEDIVLLVDHILARGNHWHVGDATCVEAIEQLWLWELL